MSAKTVYCCDGLNCTEQRKETNHWFVMAAATPQDDRAPSLTIEQWGPAKTANWKHLCGQGCVQKMVERWLTTGKLE